MDLDPLLDAAAPPLAPRTAAVQQELAALVDASGARVRPRRRGLRIAVVGGVVAAGLGATAATTAAVGIGPSGWTSWLTGDHRTCQLQVSIGPAGPDVGDGEPNKWPTPFDHARRDRVVADAEAFVAGFDYAGIDHQEAIRAYQAQEARIIAHEKATEPADEVQPPLTGNDLTVTAITAWVMDRLDRHLSAEGYDMSTRQGSDRFLMVDTAESVCR
jgi:hypothetical protein